LAAFVGQTRNVNTIAKREPARTPSQVSHLKSVNKRGSPRIVYRRKLRRLSAAEIEADLRRICKGAPALDAQAVLNDLRE